tara:strand:- start:1275 stop:2276 length:1002 start_codon:yes stop_codon:yes gene_type:complete
MRPLNKVIFGENTSIKPVWLMRQAGRYLPEFRKIRRKNKDFIKLCLNENLVPEISLQPIKRFDLDSVIIFSDILMTPYGLGQKVEFTKGFGPSLGDHNIISSVNNNKTTFNKKLMPVYNSFRKLSKKLKKKDKNLIGFIGAPWTLLVYILNKKSPKKKLINSSIVYNQEIKNILKIIVKYSKIHIYNQVKSGANVIQIFDSWSGLVSERMLEKFVFNPTSEIVEYTKSLKVPVICFPRNVINYKNYVKEVKPDAINIDYNVSIKNLPDDLKIPIQGGLDPKYLLSDKQTLKKQASKILEIFKDHPYIFNLGHGVLPQTDPNMVDYLVKFVKNY